MYGDFLRSVRTSRGLSQGELAQIVGISQPNLSAYEAGRRAPTLDTLNRILVACGYRLVADGGTHAIACPLPRAGWWPDDDLPPALADDPTDAGPAVPPGATPAERGRALEELLLLGEALR